MKLENLNVRIVRRFSLSLLTIFLLVGCGGDQRTNASTTIELGGNTTALSPETSGSENRTSDELRLYRSSLSRPDQPALTDETVQTSTEIRLSRDERGNLIIAFQGQRFHQLESVSAGGRSFGWGFLNKETGATLGLNEPFSPEIFMHILLDLNRLGFSTATIQGGVFIDASQLNDSNPVTNQIEVFPTVPSQAQIVTITVRASGVDRETGASRAQIFAYSIGPSFPIMNLGDKTVDLGPVFDLK